MPAAAAVAPPVEVTPVLRETAAIASKLLGENIRFDIEAPPNLPPINP